MNDLAIDVSGNKQKSAAPAQLPGWLQAMRKKYPGAIAEDGRIVLSPPPAQSVQPTANRLPGKTPPQALEESPAQGQSQTIGHISDFGALIILSGEATTLKTSQGRLELHRQGNLLASESWNNAHAIVVIGHHVVTQPAMRQALKQAVPIHYVSMSGRYQGVLWHGQPAAQGAALWLDQLRQFGQEQASLKLAKQIIESRLRHMREVIRQHSKSAELNTEQESIQKCLAQTPQAPNRAVLNGLEGQSTQQYYAALKKVIPLEYGFEGRNRRPPKDPFNALLSLGYTILYSHTESLLRVAGLYPWAGFYHQPHGRHATLASDLMEPFRHFIERTALAVVQRNIIKPADFQIDDNGACLLTHAARKRYLVAVAKRIHTPVTSPADSEPKTLLEQLHRQNRSLIEWLRDTGPFQPFRAR